MAYSGVLECRVPRAFHDPDPLALKLDHEASGSAVCDEEFVQAFGERDLAHFAFGRFGVGDRDDLLGEINVRPPLRSDLAAAHARIERHDDHGVEVFLRNGKKLYFFGDAQDLAADAPLVHHFHAGQQIRSEKLLVDCPVKNMPQDAQVAIDRRVLDRRVPRVPRFPKFLGQRFCDSQDVDIGEVGQKELEVIEVVGPDGTTRDEPCGKFAERHRAICLDELKSLVVQFFLEFVFDLFRLFAIAGTRRILEAAAVTVQIDPPHVSAFHETQVVPPFCCCVSSQRMICFL